MPGSFLALGLPAQNHDLFQLVTDHRHELILIPFYKKLRKFIVSMQSKCGFFILRVFNVSINAILLLLFELLRILAHE